MTTAISNPPAEVQVLAGRGVNFAADIVGAAERHGLDPALLAAVAAQETGGPGTNGGRNVVGDGGHGRGLFQIDDRFHPFARSAAAMNPRANADYAAGMIAGLLKQYGGNVRKALSAYNAGAPDAAGTTTRWSDGSRLSYANSVLRHYDALTSSLPCPARDSAVSSPSKEQSMGFNIIGGLLSAGAGFLESGGNPLAAAAMGVMGATSGGGVTGANLTGSAGNAALGALDAADEAFQVGMYGEQIRHQEQMQVQSQAFDEMMDEKSEQFSLSLAFQHIEQIASRLVPLDA